MKADDMMLFFGLKPEFCLHAHIWGRILVFLYKNDTFRGGKYFEK